MLRNIPDPPITDDPSGPIIITPDGPSQPDDPTRE